MFQSIVTIAIQCIAAIVASTCIWPECGEFVLLTSFEVLCFGIQRILLSNLEEPWVKTDVTNLRRQRGILDPATNFFELECVLWLAYCYLSSSLSTFEMEQPTSQFPGILLDIVRIILLYRARGNRTVYLLAAVVLIFILSWLPLNLLNVLLDLDLYSTVNCLTNQKYIRSKIKLKIQIFGEGDPQGSDRCFRITFCKLQRK